MICNKCTRDTLEKYRVTFEYYLKGTESKRKEGVPPTLFEAMEYSLTAGGKRVRPVLCLAAAERCGCPIESALPLALGIEMFHTASLIHDDMPCMDDDDMRRGKPSNHAVFGETMALLAGDSLMLYALEYPVNNSKNIAPERLMRALAALTSALGPSGVCGGQALDIEAEKGADPSIVGKIAALKTGALLRASLVSGAALGTGDERILKLYGQYGDHLGKAFQVVDDILDVTSTAEKLGKTPGKDAGHGKMTHVTAYGLDRAREIAAEESLKAKDTLAPILPDGDFLLVFPEYLVKRTY
jgi:geranylgeranyl diphosphate synthase type II